MGRERERVNPHQTWKISPLKNAPPKSPRDDLREKKIFTLLASRANVSVHGAEECEQVPDAFRHGGAAGRALCNEGDLHW